jgi:thioredoxin reductase (NADPH)
MDKVDTIILGSGPAGATAAIYTARAGLSTLVLEGDVSGGQLVTTTVIENFPGFPEGIGGAELVMAMRRQAERFGARFVGRSAVGVDFSSRPLQVEAGDKVFFGDTVIVATGASPKRLGLPSEERLIGKGVSMCATCDGPFFRGEVVFVIGGGDTALEEALFLSRLAKEVYVVHRRDELRASEYLKRRAMAEKNIKFIWNSVVDEILDAEKDKVIGIRLRNVKSGETSEHVCSGVFVAIGHKPNTDLFKGALELDEAGYIKTLPGKTATNVEGVFAAGDVKDPHYRQAITAAASGCMAAIEAAAYLNTIRRS